MEVVSMENIMNVIDTHRSKPISWSVISGPLPKGSRKGLEETDTHTQQHNGRVEVLTSG